MPKAPSHIPTVGNTEYLTLEFCRTCDRTTVHLVMEGDILGPCMGHDPTFKTKAQQRRAAELIRRHQNPGLFDERSND